MDQARENDESSYPAADEQSTEETDSTIEKDYRRRPRRRLATVYDAVAGKVNKKRALRDEQEAQQDASPSRLRQQEQGRLQRRSIIQHSTRGGGPFRPDEVLFRRLDAPQRYAERDVYTAHERDLPQGGRDVLPDSDLLKSIHAYSSKFYGAMRRRRGSEFTQRHVDDQSMDETALLAFGILLEEASRDVLGRRGDLVFTEARVSPDDQSDRSSDGVEVVHSQSSSAVGGIQSNVGPTLSLSVRSAKRRRVSTSDDVGV